MKMEIRAATIGKLDERTFTARAVPYSEETELWPDMFERFEPGALEASELGIKLRLEHETTIGVVTSFENREDGAYITGQISDTAAGRDAYTLLKDGALRSVSVGFRPDEETMQIIDQGERTTFVHSRATLLEVSLVSFPAYQNAAVTDFRSLQSTNQKKEKEPKEMANDEIMSLRAAIQDTTRQLEAIREEMTAQPGAAVNPLAEFRSIGEYVKAMASNDDMAVRAFQGATTGDLGDAAKPAWVDRTFSQMVEKMRVTNLFEHTNDLPKQGMSIEFPVFGEDSLSVTAQQDSSSEVKEGESLPVGKITATTGTAPVITYGGASSLTRQIIERSQISYLDLLFSRMALHYSKRIELATRSLLNESVKTREETQSITMSAASIGETGVNDWIDAILEAVDYYDDKDFPLTGLLVNKETFKHLAKLNEQPKALKFSETADRTQGEITVKTLSGSIASLPVSMVPMTKPASFYTKSGLVVQEAPGAPFRLQDEDILNLSKSFSVYGYAAHYVPDLSAFAPVKIGE